MIRNLGKVDQSIRIVAGLAMVAYVFKDDPVSPMWPILLLIGIILVTTAFFSSCPLYTLLGWSTAKSSKPAS
jgi:Protein of unknown function (DUF2892).